ncbi:DUF3305 domain-containing protein [Sedimenticola thiotaurini]|uniref:DUF3305 domain-containing protein n=1 Tax=Sedimenticola thiotaurini TaxID=1543721 RepID=A0A0F7K0H6_9GAMM|nr:DUF3305 domain-containing protein [Sedimenticola thiotaurini]AKH20488.1 hypothetical protein AAY24_09135 [Sedimenticola thiotaurini]
MSEQGTDYLAELSPTVFSLSVVMQRSPATSPWQRYAWEATGVTASHWTDGVSPAVHLVHQEGELRHYLYSGFRLQLHLDECESYYHNLCSPSPRMFVLARADEEGVPVPFLVTLSFDEANAYQEGDEVVYAVAIPAELYRWCELFVLNQYVPEKRKKRRRTEWHQNQNGSVAS